MYILPPCCFMCPGFWFMYKKRRCHPRSWPPNPLSDSPWSRSSEALRVARDLPRRAGPYRSRPGWRPRSPFAPRKSDPPEAWWIHVGGIGSDNGFVWVEVEGKENEKQTTPHQRKSCQHMITSKQVEKNGAFFDLFWGGYCRGGGVEIMPNRKKLFEKCVRETGSLQPLLTYSPQP